MLVFAAPHSYLSQLLKDPSPWTPSDTLKSGCISYREVCLLGNRKICSTNLQDIAKSQKVERAQISHRKYNFSFKMQTSFRPVSDYSIAFACPRLQVHCHSIPRYSDKASAKDDTFKGSDRLSKCPRRSMDVLKTPSGPDSCSQANVERSQDTHPSLVHGHFWPTLSPASATTPPPSGHEWCAESADAVLPEKDFVRTNLWQSSEPSTNGPATPPRNQGALAKRESASQPSKRRARQVRGEARCSRQSSEAGEWLSQLDDWGRQAAASGGGGGDRVACSGAEAMDPFHDDWHAW